MNTFVLILAVISSLCSALTSCVYAYIAWKKTKEPPKDEAWEAAIKIICAKNDTFNTADDFAELYAQLALFHDVHEKKKDKIIESLRDELEYLQESRAGNQLYGQPENK